MVKKKNDTPPRKPDKAKPPGQGGRDIPPDDKRCISRTTADPTKRCKNWRVKGRDVCYWHIKKEPVRKGIGCEYYDGPFEKLLADTGLDLGTLENEKDLTGELKLLRATLMLLLEKADNVYGVENSILRFTDQISKVAKRLDEIEHGFKLSLNPKQVAALANQVVRISTAGNGANVGWTLVGTPDSATLVIIKLSP